MLLHLAERLCCVLVSKGHRKESGGPIQKKAAQVERLQFQSKKLMSAQRCGGPAQKGMECLLRSRN